jgi:ABC-type nitrate/sulfonate/bicarbonate transport system substrate-binding protein
MTLKFVLRGVRYASRRWGYDAARMVDRLRFGSLGPLAVSCCAFWFLVAAPLTGRVEAQTKKVRVAVPGYTIAVLSFLAAKMNGYYAGEGLDVELIAMRAPTANLALIGGNVEFSAVPLAGLTTALRGAPLKLIFCQFDKPQHSLYAKSEFSNIKALRGKNLRCRASAPSTIFCCVKR